MQDSGSHYYTVERLHRMLASWPEIQALAETPQSAHGLTRPGTGATPAEPHVSKQKGAAGGINDWVVVIADVEMAHAKLASGGVGVRIVARVLTGGDLDYGDHQHDYDQTLRKMSEILEPTSASGVV